MRAAAAAAAEKRNLWNGHKTVVTFADNVLTLALLLLLHSLCVPLLLPFTTFNRRPINGRRLFSWHCYNSYNKKTKKYDYKKRDKCTKHQHKHHTSLAFGFIFAFSYTFHISHPQSQHHSCDSSRCLCVDKRTNELQMTNEKFVLISLLGDKLLQLFKSVRAPYRHTDSHTHPHSDWLPSADQTE